MPTKVVELDLSEAIQPIWGMESYDSVWALVRHHQKPLGWVWFDSPYPRSAFISQEQIQQTVHDWFGPKLLQVGLGKQIFGNSSAESLTPVEEPISIVVCTRDRTTQLAGCLKALMGLNYSQYEIIVVDNAPTNDSTAKLVQSLPVRYVREDRPGLDWARNRGIQEARYNIVAFTDDDARVDTSWLASINQAFADPEVKAVTGFVAPAELETSAQLCFELVYGGMGHGFETKVMRRSHLSELGLLWASGFGVGANMAYRRDVFDAIGLFDVALDVGTPSHGGGDVEMFHRLVALGHTLVYEPSMIVWHQHRRLSSGLQKQIYDNGRSFGVYLLTCLRNQTARPLTVLTFWLVHWFWQWIVVRFIRPGKLPRHLVLVELWGMLHSPFAYIKTQQHAQRIAQQFATIATEPAPLTKEAVEC